MNILLSLCLWAQRGAIRGIVNPSFRGCQRRSRRERLLRDQHFVELNDRRDIGVVPQIALKLARER